MKRTHCCTLIDIFVLYIYSLTKILRKIRATTFTDNYGKLRVRGMSSLARQTLLEKSLVTLAVFPYAGVGMLIPRSDWSSHMIARLITYLR